MQRFGSGLNLNPHFHVLMPDSVFVEGPGGTPVFVPAPALTDDVRRIAETTAHSVVNLLQRRGLLEPYAPPDALVQEEPLLVRGQLAGRCANPSCRRRGRRTLLPAYGSLAPSSSRNVWKPLRTDCGASPSSAAASKSAGSSLRL